MALLVYSFGVRKGLTIALRWPSYILLPMFSVFTFSAEKVNGKWFFVVSNRWTAVNLFLTLAGIASGISYTFSIFPLIIVLPLISFSIILLIILTFGKSCCNQTFTNRSGLDIETLEVVDLNEFQSNISSNGFELKPLRPNCDCICTCTNTPRRNSWP